MSAPPPPISTSSPSPPLSVSLPVPPCNVSLPPLPLIVVGPVKCFPAASPSSASSPALPLIVQCVVAVPAQVIECDSTPPCGGPDPTVHAGLLLAYASCANGGSKTSRCEKPLPSLSGVIVCDGVPVTPVWVMETVITMSCAPLPVATTCSPLACAADVPPKSAPSATTHATPTRTGIPARIPTNSQLRIWRRHPTGGNNTDAKRLVIAHTNRDGSARSNVLVA